MQEATMTELANIGRAAVRRTQSSVIFVNRKRRAVRVVAGVRKVFERRRRDGVVKAPALEIFKRRLQLRNHPGRRDGCGPGLWWKHHPILAAIGSGAGAVAGRENKSGASPMHETTVAQLFDFTEQGMRRP